MSLFYYYYKECLLNRKSIQLKKQSKVFAIQKLLMVLKYKNSYFKI